MASGKVPGATFFGSVLRSRATRCAEIAVTASARYRVGDVGGELKDRASLGYAAFATEVAEGEITVRSPRLPSRDRRHPRVAEDPEYTRKKTMGRAFGDWGDRVLRRPSDRCPVNSTTEETRWSPSLAHGETKSSATRRECRSGGEGGGGGEDAVSWEFRADRSARRRSVLHLRRALDAAGLQASTISQVNVDRFVAATTRSDPRRRFRAFSGLRSLRSSLAPGPPAYQGSYTGHRAAPGASSGIAPSARLLADR